LREAKPAAHITLLTHEKLTGLWQGHPALDSVLTFADEESVFKIASRLRGEHFNTALVLPNSPRSALEVFLARVPERIGCKRPWRSLFLTKSIALAPESLPMRKRSADEIRRSISSPSDV